MSNFKSIMIYDLQKIKLNSFFYALYPLLCCPFNLDSSLFTTIFILLLPLKYLVQSTLFIADTLGILNVRNTRVWEKKVPLTYIK